MYNNKYEDQKRAQTVPDKRKRQRSIDAESSFLRLESRKDAREEQRQIMLRISTVAALITTIAAIIEWYPDIKAFLARILL